MCRGDRPRSPARSAIEAMTSENGLVLGRTGLVENLAKGLYSNVFDAKESRIFKNAVEYIMGDN